MVTYPIQARGLTAPEVRDMVPGFHWSKRSALALVFGGSMLAWIGIAEIINGLW